MSSLSLISEVVGLTSHDFGVYANSIVAMYDTSFFTPEKNSHSAHMIRLNYRPSLRERAATTSTTIEAMDLDVLNLKLKRNMTTTSSRRAGRFRYFSNRRTHQIHPSGSDDSSVAPVEVNITKTTQMHVDDKPTRSLKTLSIEFRMADTESTDSYLC